MLAGDGENMYMSPISCFVGEVRQLRLDFCWLAVTSYLLPGRVLQ